MVSRTIAIGDIHGCALALESLLEAIQPTADDLIIPLGDYVDRGPDSRVVIDLLLELVDHSRCVPLLGNHEIMLMDSLRSEESFRFWLECGGLETIDSYGGSLGRIPEVHLAFFNGCRRYFETATHMFLHANYAPELPLDDQPDRILFWEHIFYSLPEPHYSGKTAIVGHTPQVTGEILDMGHLMCIDTYCVGDGWLTALDVDSGRVWQANRFGQLREP